MWVVGLGALLLIISSAMLALNRGRRPPTNQAHWDVVGLGTSYSVVATMLSSFSVVTAVLVANLARAGDAQQMEQMMALFVLGFVMLVGCALMLATQRGALTADPTDVQAVRAQRVMHILSTGCLGISVNMSWLGLYPLLLILGLDRLAGVLALLLLFALAAGAARSGAWLYSMMGATMASSLGVTVVGIPAALAYGLGLVPLLPALSPPDGVLALAVAVFLLCALAFVVETAMIRFHGTPRVEALLARAGPVVLGPYLACGWGMLGMVWAALVLATP